MRKFMNKISKILIFVILFNNFIPFVYAAGDINITSCSESNYKVSVLSNNGNVSDLSCHSTYANAKTEMLNYPSTSSDVAVIYNNGRIVNARYAIAKMDIKK
jgi:hypothetical protein